MAGVVPALLGTPQVDTRHSLALLVIKYIHGDERYVMELDLNSARLLL
ncbi:hypothetical protein [Paenibacillus sp. UNCCL52]|nr:hypothetical protein [Paenibacillus sp. UNCCL52]